MQSQERVAHEDRFYARAFAIATVAILGYILLQILTPLFGPLIWATFIAFLLHPLHVKLTRKLRDRQTVSAGLLTFLTFVLLIGPITALSAAFASQVGDLLQYVHTTISEQTAVQSHQLNDIPGVRQLLEFLHRSFGITTEQVQGWTVEGAREGAQFLAGWSGKLFLGALGTVADFALTLFLLFFFIRDGATMLDVGRRLIPMQREQRDELFSHLDAVTRAVVIGTGLTALLQGTMVGIAFAIVSLPSPVVFGVVSALLALLPIGGTAFVWVPASIMLAAQGHWWQAIFMFAWGALLVSLIDNLVRPLLISGRAPVATLTVFIGVLGGVATFGMIGLFLGPVVLALVIALLRFAVTLRRRKEGEEVALS